MSRWRRPLGPKDARQIAKNLGFTYRNTEGGHEQWVRSAPPPFRKLTIDNHCGQFGPTLIRYMASQVGLSVREFYAALTASDRG